MKWTVEEMEKYEGAKEYFDTLIIGMMALGLDQISVESAKEYKWLEEICNYAERQLTGRVLLLPIYCNPLEDLSVPSLKNEDFRYRLLVTTNETLHQKMRANEEPSYLIPRKDDEGNLAEIVKEGKKLTKAIMEQWKNEI